MSVAAFSSFSEIPTSVEPAVDTPESKSFNTGTPQGLQTSHGLMTMSTTNQHRNACGSPCQNSRESRHTTTTLGARMASAA